MRTLGGKMSVFVEKYLSSILIPIGFLVGLVVHSTGGSYWLTGVPIMLGIASFVLLAQVVWRFALVLALNELGYTVRRSGSNWVVDKPGVDMGPGSLSYAVEYAKTYEIKDVARVEERNRIERKYQGWSPPSGMAND